jgi:hypothetical protein
MIVTDGHFGTVAIGHDPFRASHQPERQATPPAKT